jgi:serine/threonine protein kinase/formylglycine-generating enzyme required for sulfatase activity
MPDDGAAVEPLAGLPEEPAGDRLADLADQALAKTIEAPGRGPAVSELMAECLARLSLGGEMDLEALCAQHPDQADELRQRMGRLADLGMMSGAERSDPEVVGPFTIAGLLGQGGMGKVYLAQQTAPVRRLVALKLMHAGMDAERLLLRFDAERQALAVLSHPGISQVFEAGATEDGRPWFAMEYLDGSPLTQYCDDQQLDLKQRLDLFLQVCDAVVHAHQNGILHRDLKPSNVMVVERLGRPLAKVIDFGLAKALTEVDRDSPMLTRAGQVVGTPAYMSPEQAGVTGEGVDLRTDVYALGVMLYELLVGELPLEPAKSSENAMAELQHMLAEVEPERPSRRVLEVDDELAAARRTGKRRWSRALEGDLDWIVAKAMAKLRDERYAAASTLADELRRHRADQPVLAGPPTAGYRVGKFLRRYRREAVVAGVGLVALLVALVMLLFQRDELKDELQNFGLLAREIEILELVRVADEDLWPETADTLPAMSDWRRDVASILSEQPVFQTLLIALVTDAEHGPEGLSFAEPRKGYLHSHLVLLLEALDRFGGDDGMLAEIERRAAWAESLVERTIDAHRDSWDRAIASIADPLSCPAYGGLRIEPQVGLVPLGRDPQSGLWEFAFPRPDAALPEGEPGNWTIAESTCLVFVLVPGGTLEQGVQVTDPNASGYLPEAGKVELNGKTIPLDPFFLSKYEMTQAQWLRFVGSNPARYSPLRDPVYDMTHPVEQLSWNDCVTTLARMTLQLPTGAQWEYAARAGNASPWWTGALEAPREGCANLADKSLLDHMGRQAGIREFDEGYEDGWTNHAPVDHFDASPFGLHNVIGNVWEWCQDTSWYYADAEPRAGDGLQQPSADMAGENSARELRGGSFLSTFMISRSTFRFEQPLDASNNCYGVRPARPLVR